MVTIFSPNLPHISEHILSFLSTEALLKCKDVSKLWYEIASKIILKRWGDKSLQTAYFGQDAELFLFLKKHMNQEDFDWNAAQSGSDHKITAFIHHCKVGNVKMVKLLLQLSKNEEIDLNTRCSVSGYNAFMFACNMNHTDVVKSILDNNNGNIDFNAESEDGITAFMDACREGHTDIVKLLLDFSEARDIDLNGTNNKGCTGFMEAIKAGQTEIVKLLLDSLETKQIETHTWDNDGRTPLMLTLCKKEKENTQILQLLLEDKTIDLHINQVDDAGDTALMMACKNDFTFGIEKLLQYSGIDCNIKDPYGVTPFMVACKPNYKMAVGMKPRSIYPTPVLLFLNSSNTTNIDLNARDFNGCTAFMRACLSNDIKMVQTLLTYSLTNDNIDVNAADDRGRTGLMLACEKRLNDMVQLILDHSVNIEIQLPSWDILMLN